MVRLLQIQSSNIVISARRILKFFTRCCSNTTHSWRFSMEDWEIWSIIIQNRIPCSYSVTKSQTLLGPSPSTSSLKITRWTSFGTCATRAFSTVQLTRKASCRLNLSKMQFWWTTKIKWSIAQFSMRTTLFARRCLTWMFKCSTRTLLESKLHRMVQTKHRVGL